MISKSYGARRYDYKTLKRVSRGKAQKKLQHNFHGTENEDYRFHSFQPLRRETTKKNPTSV
jgi:hypothetical protein